MKTTRLIVSLSAVCALLGLAGCSGGGASAESEHVYVEALAENPVSLNPQVAGGPIPLRFGFAVLGTLVESTDQYEILPALAKEWEFSDDNLTLTLHLEENVEWHDGEPFTAEDVAFNFQEIMPLQGYGAKIVDSIDEIETPDDHTVVLHLEHTYGPFLEALSQQALVPKHLYEDTDYVTNPHNMEPVGTGPMMFDSFESGDSVVLVKNPNWWRGETEVDRAVYPIMSDTTSRGEALLNDELDVAVVDPGLQKEVSGRSELKLMDRGAFKQYVQVMFNARQPELSDPKVRALVFSAIDRDAISELALDDLGEPADGFFPDAVEWAQNPDISFAEEFPHDVDAINAGLDDAGLPIGPDGNRFTLKIRYMSSLPEIDATANVIQSSLADVHIDVKMEAAAVSVWEEAVWKEHDFGLSLTRGTIAADPSLGIANWLECNPDEIPQNNGSGICDKELDDAAKAAATASSSDREARAEQFHVVQERAQDLMYWAPLSWYNGSFHTVNTSRWAGLDDGTGQTNNIPWADLQWQGD